MFSLKRVRFALVCILAALPLLAPSQHSGVGATAATQQTSDSARVASVSPGSTTAYLPLLSETSVGVAEVASRTTAPFCKQLISFEPGDFTNPTRIDNRYLPLVPGTQFTLDGVANTGGAPTAHRVVLTVTDLTKVVGGVRNVVLWDRDFDAGALAESELTFFAQDDSGNVWNTGEYPEEYVINSAGVPVLDGAPSTWITGVKGAIAGIQMLADPHVGTPSYLQGKSSSISFLDCAQVSQTGQSVLVPFGRQYSDVLVTNEWSPLDPAGGIQGKYYAPGVGNIQITAIGDPEGETLQLTNLVHLSPKALAQVREEALELDRRGCTVNKVYCEAPPAQ